MSEVRTKIVEIGEMVPAFAEEKLLVLFGPSANDDLRPISVIHEFEDTPSDFLKPGIKMDIGETTYTINEVGDAANKNFEELGHISIYFRSGENELLPGAIHAEPVVFPELEVGDVIRFYN